MIDFSVEMRELDGAVIHLPPPPEAGSKPLTLCRVAVMALHATFPGEERLAGDEKMKRGELARRIYTAAEPIALKAEEVTLVKRLVGLAFGPMVVEQAWAALDPPSAG